MLRSALVSHLLIGICFAIPAFVVVKVIIGSTTNAWQSTLPITVPIGSFLSAVIVWPLVGGRSESLRVSTGAGVLIGIVAHPISAIVTWLLPIILDGVGLMPPAPDNREWVQPTIRANFEVILFILFWWCLLAVFWFAWITAPIGALVGLILGAVHQFLRPPVTEMTSNIDQDEPPKPDSRTIRPPWNSIPATLIALLIIASTSGLVLFALHGASAPAAQEEVIFKKPAEGI